MTKKDFEMIAAVLRAAHVDANDSARSAWVDALADDMADALATTNPKFDRARFLAACGVQS